MPQAEGPPGNTMFCVKLVNSTLAALQSQRTPFPGEAVQPSGDVGRPGLPRAQRLARRGCGRFPSCGCGDVSIVPAGPEAKLDDLGACS